MSKNSYLVSLVAVASLLSGCVIHVGEKNANVKTQQQLRLSADDLSRLVIDSENGALTIVGDQSITEIQVDADIYTTAEKHFELTLDKRGRDAKLLAKLGSTSGFWRQSPRIDLVVRVPSTMALDVEDGSGEITISAIKANVDIDDGSGNIDLQDIVGDINIDDGSGNVSLTGVVGNVRIDDGSGELYINDITGNVAIEDGSGDLSVQHVTGMVTIDDGSGTINVDHSGGLTIINDGSGGLNLDNIHGTMTISS